MSCCRRLVRASAPAVAAAPTRRAMASTVSAARSPRPAGGAALMDLSRIPGPAHESCHANASRVVMVRKTEQRTFASRSGEEEPKFETVTRETVETFRGNRTERVTTSEKRDVLRNLPEDLTSSLAEVSLNGTPRNGVPSRNTRSPSLSPERSIPVRQKPEGKLAGLFRPKGRADGESPGSEGDFVADCLRAHNEYRRRHGVEPLKLNKKLCKHSEEWAKRLASRGVMEHRQNSEYGENIFCSWSSSPSYKVTGGEPVDNWYSEIKDHPFGREPRDLKSGHFSQVVWRASKELGVAVAKSRNGHIFVVANYSPPGNFIGSFSENVLPPVGTDAVPQPMGQLCTKPRQTPGAMQASAAEESFEEEGLRVHNEYRRKHGVPDLKMNTSMCGYAAEWARTLAREDRFGHRTDSKYGENIFCSWSSDPSAKVTAKDACDSWYSEIKDHQFGAEPRSLKSGHFTQMIWKGSEELGMGMAKGKNGRTLVVANYNPRGNMIGQFAANVPRPR
ncbi:uncharacterized protein LOC134541189 isoform X2 [Bacillus rossius redtenbacheri]|uniref:uncharacterized protein LOC134541189 isoform X2 n=1 Tax=Bacillus rossius redtenbacheri TaxID=93214 RepID=UPI002FDEF727